MRPISFVCRETLTLTPSEISEQILDVTKWPDFRGYGPIPGIKSAEYLVRSPDVVGSRVEVINLDGSRHVEQIVEWLPDVRVQLRMDEFSPPLSRLASHILETWTFERTGSTTNVARSIEMHARSRVTWPVLWLISFLLHKAIVRHLRELREERSRTGVNDIGCEPSP